MAEIRQIKRQRRRKRIRARIFGTSKKPRLCVFRSNRHIYGKLIDDEKGRTLVSVSDSELKKTKSKSSGSEGLRGKTANGFEIGKILAEKALEKKIEKVVFDRAGYKYHGRVKAVADGARQGGLQF